MSGWTKYNVTLLYNKHFFFTYIVPLSTQDVYWQCLLLMKYLLKMYYSFIAYSLHFTITGGDVFWQAWPFFPGSAKSYRNSAKSCRNNAKSCRNITMTWQSCYNQGPLSLPISQTEASFITHNDTSPALISIDEFRVRRLKNITGCTVTVWIWLLYY